MVSFIGNRFPVGQGIIPSRKVIPGGYRTVIGSGYNLFNGVIAHFDAAEFTNASPRYVDYDPDGVLNTGLIGPFAGGVPAIITVNGRRFIQIEEARTNVCWYSGDFDQWGNVASSWDDVDHFGDSMRRLVENDVTNGHRSYRANVSVDGSSQYCLSSYAKLAERTKVGMSWGSLGFPGGGGTRFNLSTGAVIDFGGDDAGIYLSKNGVYRPWMTHTSNSPSGAADFSFSLLDAAGNWSYEGDDVSGAYWYTGQVEIGAFPSSYIPVPMTTPVTRAKDQLYWKEANVPEALRGKITFQWIPYADSTDGTDKYLFDFKDSGASIRVIMWYKQADDKMRLRIDGVNYDSGALTFSARQVLTITVDPVAGEYTLSGFTTGNGVISATPYTTSAGNVSWGMSDSALLQCNGLISEPYK
jgi:hypothetical protein